MPRRRRKPERRTEYWENEIRRARILPRRRLTEEERYESEAGFGGPGTWYSRADDSGGLYARPEPIFYGVGPKFEESSPSYAGKGPKGYRRSDGRIREEVCERLTYNPHIDARDIEVEVWNGEVTLTGFVDSRKLKRFAGGLAETVSGVTDVHNRLKIEH